MLRTISITLVNDKKPGTTTIMSIIYGYMSRSLEREWRTIRYSWARCIAQCHGRRIDVDNLRSCSFLHSNDYGSEFSLLCVWFCFAVHDEIHEYEFTMFSVLRLHWFYV